MEERGSLLLDTSILLSTEQRPVGTALHVADSILSLAVRHSLSLNRLWQHVDEDGSPCWPSARLNCYESRDLVILGRFLWFTQKSPATTTQLFRSDPYSSDLPPFAEHTPTNPDGRGGCEAGTLSFPGRSTTDESAALITTLTWFHRRQPPYGTTFPP